MRKIMRVASNVYESVQENEIAEDLSTIPGGCELSVDIEVVVKIIIRIAKFELGGRLEELGC